MKVLIIKKFQNTPDEAFHPVTVLELWDATAERAIKEGKALAIPEGVDPEQFKSNYELQNKKGK